MSKPPATSSVADKAADRMKKNILQLQQSHPPYPSSTRADLLPTTTRILPNTTTPSSTSPTINLVPVSSSGNKKQHSTEMKDMLTSAIRITESTNAEGEDALRSLGQQRETLTRSVDHVDHTQMNLKVGKKTLREIRMTHWKEQVGKVGVVVFLLLIIVLIVWSKWIQKGTSK